MPTKKRIPWLRLLLTAAGTEVLYLVLTKMSWAERPRLPLLEQTAPFLGLWAGLLLLYAIAVHTTRNVGSRTVTRFVFLTSLLFRLTLIPATMTSPTRSITSPLDDAHLEILRMDMFENRTSVFADKVLSSGADLAALALAPGLLKAAGLPAALSLLYGWNPLAIKESAASSRFLPVVLLLLVLAIRAFQVKSRLKSALAFGAGLTGGLWPAACLPCLMRSLGAYTFVSLAMAAAAWAGLILVRTPFTDITYVGGSLLPAVASLANIFVTRNPTYPLILCWGAWLTIVLFRAFRKSVQPSEIPREALLAIGSFLMVSPQVLPWCFIPVAYFAAFSRNRGWLVFTATAPLTYLAFQDGRWSGWSFWLGFLQYSPAYFTLIFGWLGRKRSGQ
jgi:hypothetical protein